MNALFKLLSRQRNGKGTDKEKKRLKLSLGKHVRRTASQSKGSMSNFITQFVSPWVAELEKLKASERALWLYTNDSVGHGMINSAPVEMVNTGITPQSKPMTEFLGRTTAWEQEYQKRIFQMFEIWGLSWENFCDFTGRNNFYMLQALGVWNWKLHGIGLFQRVNINDPFRPLSTSFLPICPSRLQTPSDAKFTDEIFEGMELDENGRPVAMWLVIDSSKIANKSNMRRITVIDEETRLPNILYISRTENIAEYKQDSILTPNIKTLIDSNKAFDATVVKFMSSNLFTMFIENESMTDDPPVEWDERVWEMPEGNIIDGLPGQKMGVVPSEHPGPNYEMMMRSIYERLGIATGKGLENILHTYSASFSASRANIENAAMYNDYDRVVLNNRFNQPVMTILHYEMIVRQMLPAVTLQQFNEARYAYSRSLFRPPPERPIDRGKEAKAVTENFNNLSETHESQSLKKNQDWREVLEQQAIELAFMKKMEEKHGVKFPGPSAPVAESPVPEGDNEDE